MEKTTELFDSWNKTKKHLEFYKKRLKNIKSWEIWIAKVGINIGSEISKDGVFSRPVLVVSTHLGGDLVGIIPLTTKYNSRYKRFLLEFPDYEKYGLNRKSYLLLNNFKTISLKRLERKLNNINIKGENIPIFDKIKIKGILAVLFEKVIDIK